MKINVILNTSDVEQASCQSLVPTFPEPDHNAFQMEVDEFHEKDSRVAPGQKGNHTITRIRWTPFQNS